MTVKDAYLQVEQGLQNIAALVSSDMQKEEMDLCWNNMTNKFIDLIFMSEEDRLNPRNIQFQEIQATLDDLRVLEVRDEVLTLVTFSKGKYGTLPSNYLHLLNNRTIVGKTCAGVVQTIEVPNRRPVKSETLNNTLDNILFKTTIQSPLSSLSGNILYIYNKFRGVDQFSITSILIDYIKKPATVTYGVSGSSTIEFPDDTVFKIIRMCILYLSIVTEQNPNKIGQLSQSNTSN